MRKHAVVRSAAGGPVYAAGSFQLHTGKVWGPSVGAGWFACSASGGVKGRVYLTATRAGKNEPWEFQYMRAYLDRNALLKRNADRRAQAVSAGYISQADAEKANSDEQAAMHAPIASLPAAAPAQSTPATPAGTASEESGAEYPAPGVIAVQVSGVRPEEALVEQELSEFAEAQGWTLVRTDGTGGAAPGAEQKMQ